MNNLDLLKSLSGPKLVETWNQLTGESVKRFASRDAALARFARLVGENEGASNKLLAMLTTRVEVLDAAVEKVAQVEAQKPKRVRPTKKDIKPIKDSKQGRVNVRGRAVLPANAKRVLAGEALSGRVLAAPTPKDALADQPTLNLNYKRKPTIKPMRSGTAREKLIKLMSLPSGKGVTVKDVMTMFNLSHEQAVYRLRDLHYTGGHGVRIIGGRVYVDDRE